MVFRKYSAQEIKIFLKAIDKNLSQKAEVIIIGGTAAALAYKVSRYTQDIDTFTFNPEIERACPIASQETGFTIPFGPAGVADAPYYYEDRLQPYKQLQLNKLKIFIPEIHDLILMKTVRCFEHDLDTITELCRKNSVSPEILIARFQEEMDHISLPGKKLALNVLAALEAGFGEKTAEAVADKLLNA
ncbi:MAG: hypothetical protein GY868_00760 [Deltaproteobacteria bacterium]|nr:hypothetical protein [Deltaproteobacteria bacterium]